MLENLYKFSKNAWHVKLFKWIYGTDPTNTFKTMCPYFWTFIVTILLLPLILLLKLFGKGGSKLISKAESRKRDITTRNEKKLLDLCKDWEDLSIEECFNIYNTKCYKEYYYILDYIVHSTIRDNSNEYLSLIVKETKSNKEKRKEKFEKVKESKIFLFFSYLLSIIIGLAFCYMLYKLINIINFSPIDWVKISNILIYISVIVGFMVFIYCFIEFIVGPIMDYFKCRKCHKYIIKPFVFIGKMFIIIGSMLYATYKRHCPIITWEDEK